MTFHNVYAMGILPDEQGDLDGWTNLVQNLEEALHDQFGGDSTKIEVEVEGDRARLYMATTEESRKIETQLIDFQVKGRDESGEWEFWFETVEVD